MLRLIKGNQIKGHIKGYFRKGLVPPLHQNHSQRGSTCIINLCIHPQNPPEHQRRALPHCAYKLSLRSRLASDGVLNNPTKEGCQSGEPRARRPDICRILTEGGAGGAEWGKLSWQQSFGSSSTARTLQLLFLISGVCRLSALGY